MAKILVVDDREDNLLSIESILEQDGYSFVKATSGRQALKILLSEFDFALILMDVSMPTLNGFETATLIYEREKLRHIPIVFITAHSYGDENVFLGYRAGAVDYIYKPVNPELLRAKVAVFIELYRNNRTLVAQEQKLISINKSLENEINERKNSEEKVTALNLQLLQSIDRLEAMNKSLDQFAFMASHDLQEPLRKIRTFNERLNLRYHNLLDNEGKNCIEKIESSAKRMSSLIEDILTFSKLSGKKNIVIESDLNKIVEEVLIEMKGPIEEKGARIQVDRLPVLNVNPVLIQPLFQNLIGNSLKFTRPDIHPMIKVYAEESEGKKYCRIYVEDNGIGFDPQFSEEIFGMFKQLHTKSEYEGTGIGLALCKKIVEEHNGFITARGRVDAGATFIVSLPLNGNGNHSF